jgi:hypothetical protein
VAEKNSFQLIQGGLCCAMSFGPVHIVAAPEETPPFAVEALAIEEDTWLIMSAEPEACDPEEHPIRVMTHMIEARPEKVGSVLVSGGNPIRFLAIVHDVDQEPTCREEWVEAALRNIFIKTEQRGFKSLGLPFLGTLHGKLEAKRFVVLLSRVLLETTFNYMRRLWLITPVGSSSGIIESLKFSME